MKKLDLKSNFNNRQIVTYIGDPINCLTYGKKYIIIGRVIFNNMSYITIINDLNEQDLFCIGEPPSFIDHIVKHRNSIINQILK